MKRPSHRVIASNVVACTWLLFSPHFGIEAFSSPPLLPSSCRVALRNPILLLSQSHHQRPYEPKNGVSSPRKITNQRGDSFEKFSRDVAKVLKELRLSDEDDEVPAFLRRRRLSLTNAWELEDWVHHSTRARFLHYARTFPTSRLLRRIAPQFSFFVAWALAAILISPRGVINQAVVPLTPLSLVSTFVGALLTMRSNAGLSRLSDGRAAWGSVVLHTREVGQLIATKIYPKEPQLAFLLARHASLFSFVLKAHIRGKQEEIADVVRTMLPPVDAEYVLSQRKLPVAILAKLRQGFQQLGAKGRLTTAEEIALDRSIEQLDHALMTTERIRASPIPPVYTSHTNRLLMFYLGFLPMALRQSSLNGFVTFVVSTAVGYTMLGLDEISHLLEMPFRLMPLRQLSKFCMLDVADAMVCKPASLEESLSQLGDGTLPNTGFHSQPPQSYWCS